MPELPVRLSDLAADDYDRILLYTLEELGANQFETYRLELEAALSAIGFFPEIGASRPEFGRGIRVLPTGRHLVIYEIADDHVIVHEFRHHRRDRPSRGSESSED